MENVEVKDVGVKDVGIKATSTKQAGIIAAQAAGIIAATGAELKKLEQTPQAPVISKPASRFDLSPQKKSIKPPPRLIIYGEPKIGKTTFATSAPNVVLIPTEDGSLGVDVQRLPTDGKCKTWQDVIDACNTILTQDHTFRWLVIDTINGAEWLCAQDVCNRDFKGVWQAAEGKDAFNAWGKGDKAVSYEFRRLLAVLDQIQQKRGIGIILLAHVGLHKTGNALGADFQKFGAEVNKYTWALLTGWSDQIGFAHRDMSVAARNKEQKFKAVAINNERWISFEGGPAVDAGGRIGYEMPDKILLSWEDYESAMKTDKTKELVSQAMGLLETSSQADKETIENRIGGKISIESLTKLGKTKLESLVNWLLAHKQTTEVA